MGISKRYVIVKKKDQEEISYYEYDKKDGFIVHPKTRIANIINVNEVVVINPSFINTLIDKKCKIKLEKIIKSLAIIYEDDSDDDTPLEMALNEIELFRRLIVNKYQKYMQEKEFDLLLKKLDILENEINLRKIALYERIDQIEEKGKGR